MTVAEPLSFYVDDEGTLRFYLIDCGEGLMHLIIFPDDTVMLFDCNVRNEQEEEIISFLDKHIPEKYNYETEEYEKVIDIFVNSHRDKDHYRGLKKVNSNFKIKSIWDSGQSGATTTSDDYNYYMYLRRKLKNESEKNLLVPTPSNIPICNYGGADVYCLAAEEDFTEDFVNFKVLEFANKIQHTNSMVLLIVYGERKMLLTGDSDWKSWKEKIVPNFTDRDVNFLNTDILIASHHGSRSFFTIDENNEIDEEKYPDSTYIESIKLINPVITLISCGDYSIQHHPNKAAMKLYKEWTFEEQVYVTNKLGTLCGYIDKNGNFTVVPYRFRNNMPKGDRKFYIKCVKNKNGTSVNVKNGERLLTGCSLQFSIISLGNILDVTDRITVEWEVSNGGTGDDYFHQEIYDKGKNEADGKYCFSRELCYEGKHLLRCTIKNYTKRFIGTAIFLVEGVS